jgi:hypothetical protein
VNKQIRNELLEIRDLEEKDQIMIKEISALERIIKNQEVKEDKK